MLSLSATRAALECLGCLQHDLSEEKREAAIRWVAALQKQDGSFGDVAERDRHGFKATSDAVACLQRLGGPGCTDSATALRFFSVAWAKSARTVDETSWAVYAHCWLGGPGGTLAVTMRMWCLAMAQWFLRPNPRRFAGSLCTGMEQLPQTGDEALGRAAGLLRAHAQQVAQPTRSH